MGASESNPIYRKKELIQDFIRDIRNVYITSIQNKRNKEYDKIISKIELTESSIKFVFSDYFINNIEDLYISNIINNQINRFDDMWGGRIFEGTNAFYKFGDIINNIKFEKNTQGKFISISFPFYKINSPLFLYFDVIPQDILFPILLKLGKMELNSMLMLYPKLKSNNDLFSYLTKLRYPKVYNVLNSVYNDIPKGESPMWSKIYEQLIEHENDEGFKNILDEGNNFMVRKMSIPFLAVRALIKYHYPLVYNKLNYTLSHTPYYYEELLSSIKENKIFDEYLKTGLLPKGYEITERDIYDIENTLRYILILDENVKFDNIDTYLLAINILSGPGILEYSLFTEMGKDKVLELVDLIKDNDEYKSLLRKAKYFLENPGLLA
jgi:hypothetical protein